jgi:hypothetical protein
MTKRQLVSLATTTKLPAGIRKFWGPPPILPSEDEKTYWSFAAAIAHSIGQLDAILWLLLKDVVDHSWEIRELLRHKSRLVYLERLQREVSRAAASPVEKKVQAEFFSSPEGEAQLFLHRMSTVQAIDEMIAAAERRRSMTLSEIECYRKVLAERLRERSDHAIIEGEFAEHDPVAETGANDRAIEEDHDPTRSDPAP